jgi:exopolysaccharide biosynthesis polyprenyl glycosylphosphotransferase
MALADRGPARRTRPSNHGPLSELPDELATSGGPGGEPHRFPASDRRACAIIGLLCLWDMLVVAAALGRSGAFAPGARVVALVPIAVVSALALSAAGAYRPTWWLREHPIEMLGGMSLVATVTAWGAVIVSAAVASHTHAGPLIVGWLLLPLAWYLGRRCAAAAWRTRRPERILIVGAGEVAGKVLQLARRNRGLVVGCLDDGDGDLCGVPSLGAIDELPRVLSEREIDRLVIAFSARRDQDTLEVLRACTSFTGTIDIVPRFFDFVGATATLYNTDGLPFLSVPGGRLTRGRALVKRMIDLVGATALLVVLSPLLVFICLAILLDSGRPILFHQRRIGMHAKAFRIIKFRTLAPVGLESELPALELTPESIALHVEQAKQEAVRRATRVGAWLRTTSLDELPQLLNVLAGHMSLVGPRPLSPLEDAALEGWELLRREVRPGITGLWQVSGRSEISWEERVGFDYRQVRHWSLHSDIRVLAETLGAVLRRRGAE